MKKLTEEEIFVLSEKYNLADGHAYRGTFQNGNKPISLVFLIQ